MFPNPKAKCPKKISLIRGNTGSYFPSLSLNDEPLETLDEGFFIMLIVKTPMGETVLSKTIVGTSEGTPIMFEFLPTDTIDLAPFHYSFSIDIYTDKDRRFIKRLNVGCLIYSPLLVLFKM